MKDKLDVYISYTNYRGERSLRRVHPWVIWYGESEYHEDGPQWFLRATDVAKDAIRDFAVKDIHLWMPCVTDLIVEPASLPSATRDSSWTADPSPPSFTESFWINVDIVEKEMNCFDFIINDVSSARQFSESLLFLQGVGRIIVSNIYQSKKTHQFFSIHFSKGCRQLTVMFDGKRNVFFNKHESSSKAGEGFFPLGHTESCCDLIRWLQEEKSN